MVPRFADNPLRDRADLQRLVRDLVEPVLPHFSPGRAEVRLGEARGAFGDPAGWLEGFARPLWGLAPLAAGSGAFAHWDLWQAGLAAGTDPEHPEFWGVAGDADQRCVEMGPLGFALATAPERLWEPLAPDVRARLAQWLRRIDEVRLPACNWLFFRVLVHLGLRRVGESWSPTRLANDLDELESYAREGGWYADGAQGRRGDYYGPMAMHLGGLVYARHMGEDDPARAARLVARSVRFAEEFQHYFAADGAALPFGRSLTYRFAQGAFWGALAYADVEALPWPVVKGLYLRHLRGWLRRPVFSESGLLTVGYAYPNALMAEGYNSSQSPYWAMKAFLPLALPDDHPFWTAEEAPLPPRPAVRTLPGAGLILTTDPRTRDVVALNPGPPTLEGHRHAAAKYAKIAYATRFAFAVPTGGEGPAEAGLDGGLALSDDGRRYRARDHVLDPEVWDGVASSRWFPWPDVEVRTWTLAEPTGHLRLHHVRAERPLGSFEGGFAVPRLRNEPLGEGSREGEGVVRTPAGASALRNLLGARTPGALALGPNGHLLASLAALPTLTGVHEPGEFRLAAWVGGSADEADPFADAARYTVEADFRVLRDGEPWWSPEMGSSAARLRAMDETA